MGQKNYWATGDSLMSTPALEDQKNHSTYASVLLRLRLLALLAACLSAEWLELSKDLESNSIPFKPLLEV